MFCSINDFLKSWKDESAKTAQVFLNLTDASLAQCVTPEGRTLGFLAWHITTSVSEMLSTAGMTVRVTEDNDPVPPTAAGIAKVYERAARAVTEAVPAAWTDAQLGDEIPMYGSMWKKSDVLVSLIVHQAHHRGQMTVLMRQAGLKVPGVYGPAREEWAAMGIPAQP